MNAKKWLWMTLLSMTVSQAYAATPVYTQQNPTFRQRGGFNVQTGTVAVSLSLPYISPNQTCIGTDAQSNIVGSNCASGGGGGGTVSSGVISVPNLQYVNTTNVQPQTGQDGTAGDLVVVFPDGRKLVDSNSTHYQGNITSPASLNNPIVGGFTFRNAGSLTNNSWYDVLLVKSTDTAASSIVEIYDPINGPTQGDFATLNAAYGTNNWVHAGYIRYGDNGATGNVILDFVQNGNVTMFLNGGTGGTVANAPGFDIETTASATTLVWNYSSGISNQQIPATIGQVYVTGCSSALTADALRIESNSSVDGHHRLLTDSSASGTSCYSARTGVKNGFGLATTSSFPAMDLWVSGFVDNAILPSGAIVVNNVTVGGSGVTVYPASATASFPFGFSASTAVIGGATFNATGGGGSTVLNGPVNLPLLTANQCLQLNSGGNITTSGAACGSGGGGGGGGASTLAFTYNGVIITSPTSNVVVDTMTMNYTLYPGAVSSGTLAVAQNLTISTLALTGIGAGAWNATEGTAAGVVGTSANHDTLWADSSSHTFVFNPNNTSSYTIVGSSTVPTSGHVAQWSGQGTLVDGGLGATAAGPTAAIQFNNGGVLGGNNNFQETATSITINDAVLVQNVSSWTYTNVSSMVLSGVYFDVSQSSSIMGSVALDGPVYLSTFSAVQNANYTASAFDEVIYASAPLTGNIFITLPTTPTYNRLLMIKKVNQSTGTVIVTAATGNTIEGVATDTITLYNQATLYISSSTNWNKFASVGSFLNVKAGLPTATCSAGTPSVIGSNSAGTITEGASAATSCTLTFNPPFVNAPFCVVQTTSTLTAAAVTAVSNTSFTETSPSMTADTINYICVGRD